MDKIPLSVLVVIHTLDLQVLLIRRADAREEFWQSVTGSKDSAQESWRETALREVREETGIDGAAPGCCLVDWGLENVYSIYPQWREAADRCFSPSNAEAILWLPRFESLA